MTEQQSAAALLRELRQQRGESLRSAARGLGVDPSFLARVETGQKAPSGALRERASQYYGADSDGVHLAAGQLPPDVVQLLLDNPDEIAEIRRRLKDR